MTESDDEKAAVDDEKAAVDDETPETATAIDTSEAVDATADDATADDATADEDVQALNGIDWSRVLAYGLVPALALILAMGAGVFKYVDNSVRDRDTARTQSVQAATASTITILSYSADKVEQQLNGAKDLLTGEFRDSYSSLIDQVVIPGAKQQQISSVATVPRAGSVSAEPSHAVVLVFVNQTVTVGSSPPTATASSVNVTLDKVGDKWLISKFEPV